MDRNTFASEFSNFVPCGLGSGVVNIRYDHVRAVLGESQRKRVPEDLRLLLPP